MANARLSQHWRGIGETDNLAELSKLDEDIILDELRTRYQNDTIYVSTHHSSTSHHTLDNSHGPTTFLSLIKI